MNVAPAVPAQLAHHRSRPSWMPTIAGLPGPESRGYLPVAIPKPPAHGSAADTADLVAVRAAAAARTIEGNRWATALDARGGVDAWRGFIESHGDTLGGALQLVLGVAALASGAASSAVTAAQKYVHRRPRPFERDPGLEPLFRPTSPSYPSGHASSAFAVARVVSRLAPWLTDAAYDHAHQAAAARVYAGVHYPSDVVVGAHLGLGVADLLLARLPISAADVAKLAGREPAV